MVHSTQLGTRRQKTEIGANDLTSEDSISVLSRRHTATRSRHIQLAIRVFRATAYTGPYAFGPRRKKKKPGTLFALTQGSSAACRGHLGRGAHK